MDDFVASSPNSPPRQIAVGEFLLDQDTIRVWRKNKPLQLSMRQFRLIEVFMQRPGTAFSFQELRLAVWGSSSTIEDATVVSEIGRLRKAIGYRYGKNPIKTVRGVGFMFETEPSKAKQRRPTSSDRRLRKAETLGSDGQYEGDDPTQKQHAGRAD